MEKTLRGVDTLSCQILSCYSVCSSILSAFTNPAFVLKSRDLLTIKNKSFPTSKPQVGKKLTRRESPEVYLILEKTKCERNK